MKAWWKKPVRSGEPGTSSGLGAGDWLVSSTQWSFPRNLRTWMSHVHLKFACLRWHDISNLPSLPNLQQGLYTQNYQHPAGFQDVSNRNTSRLGEKQINWGKDITFLRESLGARALDGGHIVKGYVPDHPSEWSPWKSHCRHIWAQTQTLLRWATGHCLGTLPLLSLKSVDSCHHLS